MPIFKSSPLAAILPIFLMSVPATAAARAEPAPEMQAAPVSELVDEVSIPYEEFTLENGLKVLVHEDRNAPVVAVSVWYAVGSKDEPESKYGYAHLFEHIMFNGSENAPDDYFAYLKQIGATGFNGSTWLDRTNYYQTVPRNALESALFLESDRMGNLLGAVTQEKLDNQIAVVQNEKRQGDNQPYGLFDYAQIAMLFSPDHPYGHPTIGSMAGLSAASLQDMHDWFEGHYGPNNAVLVLAGDIGAAEARPLVQKWFGRFKAGPTVAKLDPALPTLNERKKMVLYDQVPNERIDYSWVVPGLNHPDNIPLAIGADALGGLLSSRLDNILVRDEQLAVSVASWVQSFLYASVFEVQVDVKDGVDADRVAKRLDEIIADYIATGPTAEEVARVATDTAANRIAGLENSAGKAAELAQGQLYSDNPAFYKLFLEKVAATSPDEVRAAMQKWLTRPLAEIRVVPGERGKGEFGQRVEPAPADAIPTGRLQSAAYYSGTETAEVDSVDPEIATPANNDAQISPDLTAFPLPEGAIDLDFPDVETAKLKNGATVYFARRADVPLVRVIANFSGGYSADPTDEKGRAAFATRVMQEGTTSRNARELAEEQERLGATLFGGASLEESEFGVRVVTPNLEAGIALLSDVVRSPAFDDKEVERVRAQQLSLIKSEYGTPSSLALRALPPLLYGEEHRYGMPFSGTGYSDVVRSLGAGDLRAFHDQSIRPDNMKLFVVGDTHLSEILPVLDRNFGDWKSPVASRDIVNEKSDRPAPVGSRIIVFDRPDSPQSYIVAGQVLSVRGKDELVSVELSNDVLGGDFLSRINMDLREDKGWSYGARSTVLRPTGLVPFIAYAPVQADQTVPALKVMRKLISDLSAGAAPIEPEERDRVVKAAMLELPGQYETSLAILQQMENDVKYGRPSDYAESLADRYDALSTDELNRALPALLNLDEMIWIIVGDADIVRPQLDGIDLPVEYRSFEAVSAD